MRDHFLAIGDRGLAIGDWVLAIGDWRWAIGDWVGEQRRANSAAKRL